MTCGSMRNLSDALGYSNVQIFLDHVQKNLDICASGTCRPASRGSGRLRDLPSGIAGKRRLPRLAIWHLGEADASATCHLASRGKRTLPRLAIRHLGEADASATCHLASRGSGRFRDLPSGISGKRTLPRLAIWHLGEADASATCHLASRGKRTLPRLAIRHLGEADASATCHL